MQILCGAIGLGRFYLGYNKVAVFQILASLLTCFVAGVVWGFVDGLMILNGAMERDGNGYPLAE